MNKRWVLVLVVLIFIAILAGAGIIAINHSKDMTEQGLKAQNPIFHTLEEGSKCTPDAGDCKPGLTCSDNVCAKP